MPAKAKSKLKVRIPIPKPTRFHSTPKGKRGYDRKRLKRENAFLRRIIQVKPPHPAPLPRKRGRGRG